MTIEPRAGTEYPLSLTPVPRDAAEEEPVTQTSDELDPDPACHGAPAARRPHGFDLIATLASIGALLCWSIGPNFIKYLTGHFDAWSQNAYRYVAASLFWLPLLLVSLRRRRFDHAVWRRAIVPSCANVAMQSFWAAAFYYINPAFMSLLTKSSVIWIATFSMTAFPEERPLLRSKRFWAGVALCLTGLIGVTVAQEDFTTRATVTGIVLGLIAAFLWAVYTFSARVAFKDCDSRHSFAVTSLYTVVGLSLIAALFSDSFGAPTKDVRAWACVIVSGVASIALAHVLYYVAMKRIGATIPSLIILATPFTVLAISRVAFGETLRPVQWVFGLLLVAGSALFVLAQQKLAGKAS